MSAVMFRSGHFYHGCFMDGSMYNVSVGSEMFMWHNFVGHFLNNLFTGPKTAKTAISYTR